MQNQHLLQLSVNADTTRWPLHKPLTPSLTCGTGIGLHTVHTHDISIQWSYSILGRSLISGHAAKMGVSRTVLAHLDYASYELMSHRGARIQAHFSPFIWMQVAAAQPS